MPEGERIAQNPSRVRFVVKGLGVAEERGEIRLDEPVLDMVDPMVRPASFTGF